MTYRREEDAERCIRELDGTTWDGKTLRASRGTTKYCNAFLRAARCGNPECAYLHRIANDADVLTREAMFAKYHNRGAAGTNKGKQNRPRNRRRRRGGAGTNRRGGGWAWGFPPSPRPESGDPRARKKRPPKRRGAGQNPRAGPRAVAPAAGIPRGNPPRTSPPAARRVRIRAVRRSRRLRRAAQRRKPRARSRSRRRPLLSRRRVRPARRPEKVCSDSGKGRLRRVCRFTRRLRTRRKRARFARGRGSGSSSTTSLGEGGRGKNPSRDRGTRRRSEGRSRRDEGVDEMRGGRASRRREREEEDGRKTESNRIAPRLLTVRPAAPHFHGSASRLGELVPLGCDPLRPRPRLRERPERLNGLWRPMLLVPYAPGSLSTVSGCGVLSTTRCAASLPLSSRSAANASASSSSTALWSTDPRIKLAVRAASDCVRHASRFRRDERLGWGTERLLVRPRLADFFSDRRSSSRLSAPSHPSHGPSDSVLPSSSYRPSPRAALPRRRRCPVAVAAESCDHRRPGARARPLEPVPLVRLLVHAVDEHSYIPPPRAGTAPGRGEERCAPPWMAWSRSTSPMGE